MKALERYFLAILALTLLLLPCCAHAQKIMGPFPNEMGTLYLGNSQVLAAIKPRLLTKNANITEFECAPTGTRVAYIGQIPEGRGLDETLAIATVERGDNTVYFQGQITDHLSLLGLRGWSDDAAYLAYATTGPVPDPTQPGATIRSDVLHMVDLVHGSVFDASLPFDQLIPPAGPNDPPQHYNGGNIEFGAWAPGARLYAVAILSRVSDGMDEWGICLIDPDRKTSRILYAVRDYLGVEGWVDATHIAYRKQKQHFIYDLATGKSTPVPVTPRLARPAVISWQPPAGGNIATGTNNETLTLSESSYYLADSSGAKIDTSAIEVVRTGGSAKPANMELDSFPRTFGTGNAQFLQNAGFDSGGIYHVLYVSEGDLKVVDLLPRPATPMEKYRAGEKLTCPEEIQIAESDAKQIGLGILQYAQDNQETFPPADGFHDEVYPYIKSDIFTSPNGAPFHYLAPADPKLASMDIPANTPLGEFDLACVKIVLYGDGHVQVQQNPPAGP